MLERKLAKLKQDINAILDTASHPILAWSSGKDSQLLLHLIREVQDIPVLVFPHFWDNDGFVRKMVKDWDLTAFTYRPLKIEVKANHIVAYYSIGKNILPVITDVLNFDKCGLDIANKALRPTQIPNFDWDVVITGSKKVDKHLLVDQLDLSEIDNITPPLWNWTDEEVFDVIDKLGVPVDLRLYLGNEEKYDTGSWSGCMNCQTGQKEVWCYKQNAMIAGA